jgi:hypothetical protein
LGPPYRAFDQANDFRRRCAEAFRDYNTARVSAPVTAVPEEDRARIRTAVASARFVESYGRPPTDAQELSGHLARISRQATTAVAGYDLTFSPVKSVSTLWAIAPPEVAAVIEQAHADAVAGAVPPACRTRRCAGRRRRATPSLPPLSAHIHGGER